MYEYIKGTIHEITPANVIIDSGGMGYHILISVHTFSLLKEKKETLLYLHQVVREDAHLLYGFAEKQEREIFRLLISVSGIGAGTALLVLSSLTPVEVSRAIASENVTLLRNIKGIGTKTAQRIIVDLKDKVGRIAGKDEFLVPADNTILDEALSALVTLGFGKAGVNKVVEKILSENPEWPLEDIIKEALKHL
ncbi:MAG: Holliday junction branch migration protein RuvA [Chlorobi bacterium]|nr:Holliday junction branch migration protein RuvA [Chlorobiota bacterium]